MIKIWSKTSQKLVKNEPKVVKNKTKFAQKEAEK